jgi:hypothetical protein
LVTIKYEPNDRARSVHLHSAHAAEGQEEFNENRTKAEAYEKIDELQNETWPGGKGGSGAVSRTRQD